MASNYAHHATGFAAGVIAAVVVLHAGASGPYHVWSVIAFMAGVSGGTAPDWLEVAWWSKKRKLWITHRTWTHWGLAWIALFFYSYFSLRSTAWAPLAFGFAAGGLMHLLADWPNPLGVPWLVRRHSLNLWKSGKCDLIVITLSWTLALLVTDSLFFRSEYLHKLLALIANV